MLKAIELAVAKFESSDLCSIVVSQEFVRVHNLFFFFFLGALSPESGTWGVVVREVNQL